MAAPLCHAKRGLRICARVQGSDWLQRRECGLWSIWLAAALRVQPVSVLFRFPGPWQAPFRVCFRIVCFFCLKMRHEGIKINSWAVISHHYRPILGIEASLCHRARFQLLFGDINTDVWVDFSASMLKTRSCGKKGEDGQCSVLQSPWGQSLSETGLRLNAVTQDRDSERAMKMTCWDMTAQTTTRNHIKI